jgi:HYDIN/CFA65/VesB-like, Ig-like domain
VFLRLSNYRSVGRAVAIASLLAIALVVAGCASVTPKSASTQPGPVAALQVTPSSISFGNQTLQSTTTENVTIKNTGNINVTINGITVVGAGFGYSTLSPGSTLTPNQSVTFQVWFRPQVSGSAAGNISVLSSNLSTPASISVSGTGVTSAPTSPSPVAHSVLLSWSPSASAVAGYRVYRDNGSGLLALTSVIPDLAYTDTSVVSGSTYHYAVTAVDAAGAESTLSNEVTAVIPTP